MTEDASDMSGIMKAVALVERGERELARTMLLQLWDDLGQAGTPRQRCTIAHFLADTEEDAEAELAWDILALEAATGAAPEQGSDALTPELMSFLPSLHLNVGDAYRRVGKTECALAHAHFGLERICALPAGGYRDMVKGGLERLKTKLCSTAGVQEDQEH